MRADSSRLPEVVFIGKNPIPEPVPPDLQKKLRLLARSLRATLIALGPVRKREREGCTIIGFPPLRPPFAGGIVFYLLAPLLALGRAIRHPGVAIVCQSPFEAFGVAVLRPLVPGRRRPLLVIEAHGDWRTASRLYGSSARRLVAPLADSVAEWTVRRADRVRVVAGYLEEMVRDAGYRGEVDRYVTFSDFGSFLDEPPLPVPLEPRVAFAAAFEPYKAVDVLIDAWAKVVAKIPSAMLEMGGSGSQEGAIRERVKRAGLTDNVKFLGSLDRGQVKDLLDRSRFLTLPSRSEGLPRLIMESMARARAVVTTPVGDIPLLIEDGVNGLMVRPDDSDGLATALCRLLEDQELCSTLGRAGYDRVRERDPVRDYEAGVQRLADWAASKGKS